MVFHRWLDPQVMVEGDFSSLLLRDVAMEVARRDEPAVVEYLESFRLSRDDEEAWEEEFHEWVGDHCADWYVYSMAGHMRACPRPSMAAYKRLQWLLPKSVGWSAHSTASLLDGWPLRFLLEDYGDRSLHNALGRDLRAGGAGWPSVGGGWLPAEAVGTYRDHLDRSLCAIPETELAGVKAYVNEVTAMLDAAIERDEALRMVIVD